MASSPVSFLNPRVLRVNVGFLLSEGPAHHQDSRLDIPDPIRVADDFMIYGIEGDLRLSRAKEGILVEMQATVYVDGECSRCLDDFKRPIDIDVQELYAHPASDFTEFSITSDNNLDLAPLIRAEAMIGMAQKALCRPDCQGLCPTCGKNRNHETCTCADEVIDPRLAKLKELMDKR